MTPARIMQSRTGAAVPTRAYLIHASPGTPHILDCLRDGELVTVHLYDGVAMHVRIHDDDPDRHPIWWAPRWPDWPKHNYGGFARAWTFEPDGLIEPANHVRIPLPPEFMQLVAAMPFGARVRLDVFQRDLFGVSA